MKYSAITYTADPRIGLVSPGEMLTEEQVGALGAEKINELVERKVLMAWPEEHDAASANERTPAPDPTGDQNKSGEESKEENPEEETEDEDDLPELNAMEDIVSDNESEPTAPKKKGGRRKTE